MDYETAAKIVEECCGGCRTASDETVKARAVVDSEIERLRAALLDVAHNNLWEDETRALVAELEGEKA
jgi:hypothetical protein